MKEKKYQHIKPLVAFSGKVIDGNPDNPFTESMINGFSERELPGKFNTSEYQILLVADKYQYGYDQPLLHTMYVDKQLSGVKAVQTLSRLNRTYPGKENTFVLDFTNETDVILESFKPFYEMTVLSETTDPNLLYDLKSKIESKQVIWQTEIDNFSRVYFKTNTNITIRDHEKLNVYLDPAVDRFKVLNTDEEKDDFKHSLLSFTRIYSYLSQIIPFQDVELEKFFTYGRFLFRKLPKDNTSEKLKLDDEVALEYYRLQKMEEVMISLEPKGKVEVDPTKEAGLRKDNKEKAHLSEIIQILNDRFGTDFSEADKLFFDQIEAELVQDDVLYTQARNNTLDNFQYAFDDKYLDKVIERMDQNQDIFKNLLMMQSLAQS